jgi:SAM-dependent methyltransferase
MGATYDTTLFEGTARYYARFRPKYPKAAFAFLAERFGLDARARVLDLGCGTGDASLPLAPLVGEIVAMDPDPGMITVGRELAAVSGLTNVMWMNAGSNDLSPALGVFRLVCMGKSFHWMDRDRVLRDLYGLVEDSGGIALLGPAHGLILQGVGPPLAREPWWIVAEDLLVKYIGARPRHPRSNPQEPRHEPALLRSRFAIAEYHEFETELALAPEDIAGHLYSMSGNVRQRLGARIEAFEAELADALRSLTPDARFVERSRSAVLVAVKS